MSKNVFTIQESPSSCLGAPCDNTNPIACSNGCDQICKKLPSQTGDKPTPMPYPSSQSTYCGGCVENVGCYTNADCCNTNSKCVNKGKVSSESKTMGCCTGKDNGCIADFQSTYRCYTSKGCVPVAMFDPKQGKYKSIEECKKKCKLRPITPAPTGPRPPSPAKPTPAPAKPTPAPAKPTPAPPGPRPPKPSPTQTDFLEKELRQLFIKEIICNITEPLQGNEIQQVRKLFNCANIQPVPTATPYSNSS